MPGGAGGTAYTLMEELPGHWRNVASSEIDGIGRRLQNGRLLRLQTLSEPATGRGADTGPEFSAMGFQIQRFKVARYSPSRARGWTTTRAGLDRLVKAERIGRSGTSINYKRYFRFDE